MFSGLLTVCIFGMFVASSSSLHELPEPCVSACIVLSISTSANVIETNSFTRVVFCKQSDLMSVSGGRTCMLLLQEAVVAALLQGHSEQKEGSHSVWNM